MESDDGEDTGAEVGLLTVSVCLPASQELHSSPCLVGQLFFIRTTRNYILLCLPAEYRAG